MKTLKALGALLAYPTPELIDALPDLHAVIVEEGMLGSRERRALKALMQRLATADLMDLEERYVDLFDRGRATSLHLFEHVHGDSRDRGQAMVDLGRTYEAAGFHLDARELPDYLPVLLEFLSRRPLAESREMLGECAHLLRSIGESLQDRGSDHAAVLAALLRFAGADGLAAPRAVAPTRDEPTLDEEWAEAPAFGPASATDACSAAAAGRGGAARPQPFLQPPRAA